MNYVALKQQPRNLYRIRIWLRNCFSNQIPALFVVWETITGPRSLELLLPTLNICSIALVALTSLLIDVAQIHPPPPPVYEIQFLL